MYEVYEEDDSILPHISLSDPCSIRVELKDDCVRLFVGPRDWSWNRKTGKLIGAGTALDNPMPDGG